MKKANQPAKQRLLQDGNANMANFESVLEKYDAKGNRRMPTAEEDAIQPDTTLEGLLIGPGTAAASGIAKGVNRLLNKSAPRITAPEIGSNIPAETAAEAAQKIAKYLGNKTPRELRKEKETLAGTQQMRNARDRSTMGAVKNMYGEVDAKTLVDESGLGDAAAKAATAGRDKVQLSQDSEERLSKWAVTDYLDQKAARKKEMLQKAMGQLKKYAKGGSVSSRADGIAQRGKTKGRMC